MHISDWSSDVCSSDLYIPAVDKGIQETLPAGVVAGYPVVDVKVTLFFGSYHDVDSNENAFRMAASMAFKDGMRKASPVLLEPMLAVEVETPEHYAGPVVGDLYSGRGMVPGMDALPVGGTVAKETGGATCREEVGQIVGVSVFDVKL